MNTKILKLDTKAEMPLAIVTLILGVITLMTAVLINFAYVFGIIGLFFFLPTIVVGVLVITQEENKNSFFFAVVGLGCCQVATVLWYAWAIVQIMKVFLAIILKVL